MNSTVLLFSSFQIVPNVVQTSRRSPMCLLSDDEKASKAEQVSMF